MGICLSKKKEEPVANESEISKTASQNNGIRAIASEREGNNSNLPGQTGNSDTDGNNKQAGGNNNQNNPNSTGTNNPNAGSSGDTNKPNSTGNIGGTHPNTESTGGGGGGIDVMSSQQQKQLVLGRFELVQGKRGMLGEGSFSSVQKAKDVNDGTEVAVKTYKSTSTDEQEVQLILKKFKRQISVLRSLCSL